jgi:hypothetical protein
MDLWLILLGGFEYLLDFVVDPLDVVDPGLILHVFEEVFSAVILSKSGLLALCFHFLAAKRISLHPIVRLSIPVRRIFLLVPMMFRPFSASAFIPPFVIFSPVAVLFVLPGDTLSLRHLGHVNLKVLPLLLSEIILGIQQVVLLTLGRVIVDRGHYLSLSFVCDPFGTPPAIHPSASI